jgi:UDP-N-acetylglucosamine 2-epimerase
MLEALEPIIRAERPEAVVVFGDTNSTLAGALTASKLGIPVAHVEAGLRSFDRRMPEEINRVVADHLSRWLFTPTPTAVENLAREGIHDNVLLVGDLMQDLAARSLDAIRDPGVLAEIASTSPLADRGGSLAPGRFLYATVHRQENREPTAVREWASLLSSVARPDRPVILALHPGTRAVLDQHGVALGADVIVVDPLGYRTSLALQLHAAAVLTDSGGVQREAAWLNVPCLILREITEWTEAVETSQGRMVLVARDRARAAAALARLAPEEGAPDIAQQRARSVQIEQAGAAEAIAEALAA